MHIAKFAFAAAVLAAGPAHCLDGHLEGDALRKAVAGKIVTLQTPLGSLPISYRADGTMRSSTVELAAYTGSSADRGIWWVRADQLCQRWTQWLGGRSYCFKLRQEGRLVQWTRNDGLSGTATIRR